MTKGVADIANRGDSKRLKYEDVYAVFKADNCELITGEYKNNSTKMVYRCVCGDIAEITYASFREGSRCAGCKARKAAERATKYSIEEVREIFSARGCTLLSTEYKSTKVLLDYICVCGHIAKIRLTNFKDQGNKCIECKRKSLSGENHYLWNPNLSDKERKDNASRINDIEIARWRRRVFKRDNYTCLYCNNRGNLMLNAHHIDGYNWCVEKRTQDANGATLCEVCHVEFHKEYGKGDNTRSQFDEWLRGRSDE
jgi:hypothetical protein